MCYPTSLPSPQVFHEEHSPSKSPAPESLSQALLLGILNYDSALCNEHYFIAPAVCECGPPLFSFVKPSASFPQSCSSRNVFLIRFTPSVQYFGAGEAVECSYVITVPAGSRH